MSQTLRFASLLTTYAGTVAFVLTAGPARLYAEIAPPAPSCDSPEVTASADASAGSACDQGGTPGTCESRLCDDRDAGGIRSALRCVAAAKPGPSPTGSSPSELDRKTAKFTEYLGNKKVQIADKQSSTDEKRLAPEFSKLANALRPTFSISCGMESRQGLTLEVQCTFTNQGSNRATVTLRGVSIVDKQALAELPGMVEQFTPPEGEGNTVLPGLTGSNTYFIRLTAAGLQSRQAALRIRFAAATDTVALNVVRRQSKGILTDEELNQLSVQGYVYHLRYN